MIDRGLVRACFCGSLFRSIIGDDMEVSQAQADVRRVYRAGFLGPLVSSVIWAAASAVFTWGSAAAGMAALFFGGMLIFPLGTLVMKLLGGPTALPKGHPSAALAMQCAFTVPLGLLVAIALGSYEPVLFFPAALIIVGAHYLLFISLYGTRLFAVLAGALSERSDLGPGLGPLPALAPCAAAEGALAAQRGRSTTMVIDSGKAATVSGRRQYFPATAMPGHASQGMRSPSSASPPSNGSASSRNRRRRLAAGRNALAAVSASTPFPPCGNHGRCG